MSTEDSSNMDSVNGSANHVNDNENYHDSAETSPDGTIASSALHRVESEETLISSERTEVASVASSQDNPGLPVPPNTAYTQSVVSDLLDEVNNQLNRETTPPAVMRGRAGDTEAEGKAHLRGRVRGDVPLLQQLFKQPPKAARRVRRMTKKAVTGVAQSSREAEDQNHIEHVHEQSTWYTLAMEDVSRGLERLAMAAKDLNKIESGKTVEEHYNEKLAEVLKAAEIRFDPKYLE